MNVYIYYPMYQNMFAVAAESKYYTYKINGLYGVVFTLAQHPVRFVPETSFRFFFFFFFFGLFSTSMYIALVRQEANEDGTPWLNVGSGLRLASARYGGDKRRIDSELRAVPQWEAICDNLDAPVINDGHIDIHVGHAHVAGNRGTSLPAGASDGALKWERTRLRGRRGWRKPTGDPRVGQGDPGIGRCAGQAAAASAGGGAGGRGSGHWG